MIEKITKAFTFKATIEEKENVYIPKVQSTYTPPKADFNEVFAGVYEQLKLKYDNRRN
jgi:hypothetical protein